MERCTVEPPAVLTNNVLEGLLNLNQELNSTHDLDFLLNKILQQARRLMGAEAGSIFLAEDRELKLNYVHNEVQGEGDGQYVGSAMPIDETSLAGYSAKTGETLNVPDAYCIPADRPYRFNTSWDQSSGYRTVSVLVAPLTTSRGETVGVLEVINARGSDGAIKPFDRDDERFITFYANNAALVVERAKMMRELILRMIRMSRLRDPAETGAHVNRVGSIAAAIYEAWALSQGESGPSLKHNKDLIRVSAMLHDVGKVAISDAILKKPAKLDEEEFKAIKYHTIYGAQLFPHPTSELDFVARDIALNHHQRWDGRGYPGRWDPAQPDQPPLGPGLKGEEISAFARITCLADVFDALSSPRAYKRAWPQEKVLALIKEERGRQFDPVVVDAFLDIYDEVLAICQRYQG